MSEPLLITDQAGLTDLFRAGVNSRRENDYEPIFFDSQSHRHLPTIEFQPEGRLTAADFANFTNATEIFSALTREGYIGPQGQITFTGNLAAFRTAFTSIARDRRIRLANPTRDIEIIFGVLDRARGVAENITRLRAEINGHNYENIPDQVDSESLNELLRRPEFFDRWMARRTDHTISVSPTAQMQGELDRLERFTHDFRSQDFADLSPIQQAYIMALNRLILEVTYTTFCPQLHPQLAIRPLQDNADLDGDSDTTERNTVSEAIAYDLRNEFRMGDPEINDPLAQEYFYRIFMFATHALQRNNLPYVWVYQPSIEGPWSPSPLEVNAGITQDTAYAWRWVPSLNGPGTEGGVIYASSTVSGFRAAADDLEIPVYLTYAYLRGWDSDPFNPYLTTARALTSRAWDNYVVEVGGLPVLSADDYYHEFNSSYYMPDAYAEVLHLLDLDPDHNWPAVAETSLNLVQHLNLNPGNTRTVIDGGRGIGRVTTNGLNPDWFQLDWEGQVAASAINFHLATISGWDAARVLARMAQAAKWAQDPEIRATAQEYLSVSEDPMRGLLAVYDETNGRMPAGLRIDGTRLREPGYETRDFATACYMLAFAAAGANEAAQTMLTDLTQDTVCQTIEIAGDTPRAIESCRFRDNTYYSQELVLDALWTLSHPSLPADVTTGLPSLASDRTQADHNYYNFISPPTPAIDQVGPVWLEIDPRLGFTSANNSFILRRAWVEERVGVQQLLETVAVLGDIPYIISLAPESQENPQLAEIQLLDESYDYSLTSALTTPSEYWNNVITILSVASQKAIEDNDRDSIERLTAYCQEFRARIEASAEMFLPNSYNWALLGATEAELRSQIRSDDFEFYEQGIVLAAEAIAALQNYTRDEIASPDYSVIARLLLTIGDLYLRQYDITDRAGDPDAYYLEKAREFYRYVENLYVEIEGGSGYEAGLFVDTDEEDIHINASPAEIRVAVLFNHRQQHLTDEEFTNIVMGFQTRLRGTAMARLAAAYIQEPGERTVPEILDWIAYTEEAIRLLEFGAVRTVRRQDFLVFGSRINILIDTVINQGYINEDYELQPRYYYHRARIRSELTAAGLSSADIDQIETILENAVERDFPLAFARATLGDLHLFMADRIRFYYWPTPGLDPVLASRDLTNLQTLYFINPSFDDAERQDAVARLRVSQVSTIGRPVAAPDIQLVQDLSRLLTAQNTPGTAEVARVTDAAESLITAGAFTIEQIIETIRLTLDSMEGNAVYHPARMHLGYIIINNLRHIFELLADFYPDQAENINAAIRPIEVLMERWGTSLQVGIPGRQSFREIFDQLVSAARACLTVIDSIPTTAPTSANEVELRGQMTSLLRFIIRRRTLNLMNHVISRSREQYQVVPRDFPALFTQRHLKTMEMAVRTTEFMDHETEFLRPLNLDPVLRRNPYTGARAIPRLDFASTALDAFEAMFLVGESTSIKLENNQFIETMVAPQALDEAEILYNGRRFHYDDFNDFGALQDPLWQALLDHNLLRIIDPDTSEANVTEDFEERVSGRELGLDLTLAQENALSQLLRQGRGVIQNAQHLREPFGTYFRINAFLKLAEIYIRREQARVGQGRRGENSTSIRIFQQIMAELAALTEEDYREMAWRPYSFLAELFHEWYNATNNVVYARLALIMCFLSDSAYDYSSEASNSRTRIILQARTRELGALTTSFEQAIGVGAPIVREPGRGR